MPNRKLALRKSTLTELTPDDLRGIAGADAGSGVLCDVTQSCVPCTGYYPSIFDPCQTNFC